MFADWEPSVVAALHKYFEAFSALYGCIQIKDAWKVFKNYEPNIHKKQFIEFSEIVRRENVPYYIFEIDEIYCDEKRIATERFIVNKQIITPGYGKFRFLYTLIESQSNKPYYAPPDLLTIAAHRLNDEKLRAFVAELTFSDGEHEGEKFSDAVFMTRNEQIDIDYFKSAAKKQAIRKSAMRPLSDKLMDKLIRWTEFSEGSPMSHLSYFLKEIDFAFESDEQIKEFMALIQDFVNNSHLWRNCGYTPSELFAKYSSGGKPMTVSFGEGIQRAIAAGDIDKDELIKKLREYGVDVDE